MKIRYLSCLLLAVLLLQSGCALPRWMPPEEGSRIVVYRPGSLVGFAKRHMLALNGEKQAIIGNGEYFVMDVAAGSYKVSLDEKEAVKSVRAQEARAHYLRIVVTKPEENLEADFKIERYKQAAQSLEHLNEVEPYEPPEEDKSWFFGD